jgi:hypothetical protein
MRRSAAVFAAVVMVVALAAPGRADAHSTAWYWSTGSAEYWLMEKYEAVAAASCRGTGKWMRSKSGRRLYKHFSCGVAFDVDETDAGVLHVTGKHRAVMKWD